MSVRETVNAWFGERLANGALARDTEAYNQVFGALGDLIARLDPADMPPQSVEADAGATEAAAPPAAATTAFAKKSTPSAADPDAAPSTPTT